ncbi:MAG: FecR domain-containing protein [Elusimicrobia bacterium]|nr:FecR domain-containing protein [Elusimicrobiota bacterium]
MKTIKKFAALFAVMLALNGFAGAQDAPAGKADEGNWDARVYNIRGKVYLKQSGEGSKWTALARGVPLEDGDTVKTGNKSKADISLDGRGIIALSPSSVFEMKTLRHKSSSFILRAGRFVAKVTGLKERLEAMELRTPTAVAAVRGTEFAMNYAADSEETAVTIFDEGQVLVTSLDGAGNPVGNSVMLTPRHEVKIKKEMDFISPYETKDLKVSDSDIIAARKKLGALAKTYAPMEEKQREELRKEVLSRKSGAEKADENYESSRSRGDREGAADGNAAAKGARSSGHNRGGANADAQAGGENKARAYGGASTNVSSRPGAKSSEDSSISRKTSAGTAGFTGTKNTPGTINTKSTTGATGTRRLTDSSVSRSPTSAIGAKSAASTLSTKSAASVIGAKSPAATELTTIPKLNTATSLNTKSATLGADTSRAGTVQEKNVDTIVGQLQNRLAVSGNAGAISSSELRTMVNSAMKGSANNTEFNQKLNNDISTRLGGTTGTTGGTTGTTITTKPGIITKPDIAAKPGITTDRPIITRPTIETGNTKPPLKRKP